MTGITSHPAGIIRGRCHNKSKNKLKADSRCLPDYMRNYLTEVREVVHLLILSLIVARVCRHSASYFLIPQDRVKQKHIVTIGKEVRYDRFERA